MSYRSIIYHLLNPQNRTIGTCVKLWKPFVARRDITLILAFFLGKEESYIIAHEQHTLTLSQTLSLFFLLKKRAEGFPLAYITGTKEFYNLPFRVTTNTLIPRPESEHIVERILELLTRKKESLVLDIGTGSGAIILSIATNIPNERIRYVATDISQKALIIARANAANLGIHSVTFVQSDLLENIAHTLRNTKKQNIIIAANLPYVDEDAKEKLLTKTESCGLRYEPHDALFAAEKGLFFYRKLAEELHELTHSTFGKKITVLCEINPDQNCSLTEIIKNVFPTAQITIHEDLSGRNRVVEYTI